MRARLRRTVVPASLAVAAVLALPSLSFAQATRTWVNGLTGGRVHSRRFVVER